MAGEKVLASRPDPFHFLNLYGEQIKQELLVTASYQRATKDILIVTHNQLPFLQQCVDSIRQHTEDYTVYVWDNASSPEMGNWLKNQPDIKSFRSEVNEGFIKPNNFLASQGQNSFLIILNNDTFVHEGWDKAMISHCQRGYAQVGYVGGWLDGEGKGACFGWGEEVDYIPGWCFAIPRNVYSRFGLFDEEHLEFAYGEDADFSLRLTEAGERIYALHLDRVFHYENVTIREVREKKDCRETFEANHAYLRARHGGRLGRNSLCVRVINSSEAT